MPRQNISSGSPLEEPIGFSRAVRIGDHIAVSGTAPIADDGLVAHPGDLYRQAAKSAASPGRRAAVLQSILLPARRRRAPAL